MINYNHNFGSTFPTSAPTFVQKKDIDDSVKSMVETYYSYIDNEDISGAYQYYESNKNILEPYIINSAFINRLSEEVYNMGVYSLHYAPTIVSNEEPESQLQNGSWFQPM